MKRLRLINNIYNGVELNVAHSFGCSSYMIERNGLFISEDFQTIVYPSGGHLRKYDLVTHENEYIPVKDAHNGTITAMASGLTKKRDIVLSIATKEFPTDEFSNRKAKF